MRKETSAYSAMRWQTGETGCPRLEEALVSFDCHISQVSSQFPQEGAGERVKN
jgi:flavin reductase (DIM6/NTAB) family NADH-FMN oxidoreductase RutF